MGQTILSGYQGASKLSRQNTLVTLSVVALGWTYPAAADESCLPLYEAEHQKVLNEGMTHKGSGIIGGFSGTTILSAAQLGAGAAQRIDADGIKEALELVKEAKAGRGDRLTELHKSFSARNPGLQLGRLAARILELNASLALCPEGVPLSFDAVIAKLREDNVVMAAREPQFTNRNEKTPSPSEPIQIGPAATQPSGAGSAAEKK